MREERHCVCSFTDEFSTLSIVILTSSVARGKDLALDLLSAKLSQKLMREERYYYVYLLTSSSRRVLYTGVTNNLTRRLQEHRAGECEFTAKYKAFRLVHLESFLDVRNAIEREKTIKGWRRERKDRLVDESNPQWRDLAVRFGLPIWPRESETQGPSLRSG